MTTRTTLMKSIDPGMNVYDLEGDKIGTVDEVYFGEEDVDTPEIEAVHVEADRNQMNDFMDAIRSALTTDNEIPAEFRDRMQRIGFIRIDTGLLSSDRLALANQISQVTTDGVQLAVKRDDLIKN